MSNFPKIVDLREKHFTKPYPADTIVEVNALALPELMIEIEAIGLVEGEIIDSESWFAAQEQGQGRRRT